MRTTYKITMSDGALFDIQDQSAACAIQAALIKHPGHSVKICRSGLTQDEAREYRRNGIDTLAIAGYINHDIPKHTALTFDEAVRASAPNRRKKTDATEAMFNDAQIQKDSKIAKNNFERRAVFGDASKFQAV